MCLYAILSLLILLILFHTLSKGEYALAQLNSIRKVGAYSVPLRKIPYYCLTVGNQERVEHITKGFKEINLRFVYPPLKKMRLSLETRVELQAFVK